MPRSKKIFKKKCFTGNKYTTATAQSSKIKTSASKQKLLNTNIDLNDYNNSTYDQCNVIFHVGILSSIFSQTACPSCFSKTLHFSEEISSRKDCVLFLICIALFVIIHLVVHQVHLVN